MPRGGKRFGSRPELLEAGLDDAHLVGLVVDREVRAVAEAVGLAPQDAAAGGVERHHPHAARRADELLDALAHLGRGAVRERDREDLVRPRAALAEQVADARGEHARLARAGARDHERGPVGQGHRLPLGGVQPCEQLVGRVGSRAHGSTIATAFAGACPPPSAAPSLELALSRSRAQFSSHAICGMSSAAATLQSMPCAMNARSRSGLGARELAAELVQLREARCHAGADLGVVGRRVELQLERELVAVARAAPT